ncbi:MAG: glycerol-3-phosphate dehydrogenase/oxidase [bacterium]
MKRNIANLAAQEYDIIIIGGGIYGAWAAWDAALRGLSVALLEKSDFGAATSSNSMKIIHGGLRYLQHLDFKRMRESIRERTILMRVAPHLVHPLPCLMPTYGHGLKGREVMSIVLFLNDLISYDRNRLGDPKKHIPGGKTYSRAELKSLLPGIPEKRLTGGAQWYDCQIYNSERLMLSLLHGAVDKGAHIANYAQVIDFIHKENRIIGVKVRDCETSRNYNVFGKVVLNTSGPWINKTLGMLNGFQSSEKTPIAKGINLIVNRQLIPKFGVGVPSTVTYQDADAVFNKGSRFLFFTPWRKYTILGTTYFPFSGDENNFAITEKDICGLLDEFNQAYPAMQVKREEISSFHAGMLPATANGKDNAEVNAEKQFRLIDHKKASGLEGLISVLGVKYTTARDVSSKAVDLAVKKLPQKGVKSRTASEPIPGGNIEIFEDYLTQETAKRPWGLAEQVAKHLVYNFGSRYTVILQYLRENETWSKPVSTSEEVIIAEVVHGVREEMALTLDDVIKRRTELGSAACPDDISLQKCAEIMAIELGWDTQKIAEEITATKASYVPASSPF